MGLLTTLSRRQRQQCVVVQQVQMKERFSPFFFFFVFTFQKWKRLESSKIERKCCCWPLFFFCLQFYLHILYLLSLLSFFSLSLVLQQSIARNIDAITLREKVKRKKKPFWVIFKLNFHIASEVHSFAYSSICDIKERVDVNDCTAHNTQVGRLFQS